MTVENIWMADFAIGTLFGAYLFGIWVKNSEISYQWLRAIGCLFIGVILGAFLGECFSGTRKSMIIAISISYFIAFLTTCTDVMKALFKLLPEKLQKFLQYLFVGTIFLIIASFIFGKSIKWVITLTVILLIIAILKKLFFKKLPKWLRVVITIIVVLSAIAFIGYFIIHKAVQITIIAAIIVVTLLAI